MTTLDKDGVTVAALGTQAQSQRTSAPRVGISKVGRQAREKVFVTEAHIKPNRLGRESPIRDTITLKSTLNPKPEIKFGTGGRGKYFPGTKVEDPGDIPTNDALYIVPDSQKCKYRKEPEMVIGTDPRGKLKDAELLKNHAAAFYAKDSPGPAAIGEQYGPDFTVTKPRMAPARPFGCKTKIVPDVWLVNYNPEEVGPGLYPVRDVAIGQQHLTRRRNQSVHAFPRGPKFAKEKTADTISKLDAARSCFGKQPLQKNRSEPMINFNCDTRATRDRSQICRTQLDKGPSAFMAKPHFSMPTLPSERAILAGGIG